MKRVFGLLLAVILCVAVLPTAASADETITDYDGYTFDKWVTREGDSFGTSVSQFYSTYYLRRLGNVGGKTFTLEAAGTEQYYIRATDSYNTVYLCIGGTTEDGGYYLEATTNKSSALLWTLKNGYFYTTVGSTEYMRWILYYGVPNPYDGKDAFRLTTDSTNTCIVSYSKMPLTPPKPAHTHSV